MATGVQHVSRKTNEPFVFGNSRVTIVHEFGSRVIIGMLFTKRGLLLNL